MQHYYQKTNFLKFYRSSMNSIREITNNIDDIAIAFAFTAFLAGGFTLSRIDPKFIALGWLNNVVYWFLPPLIVLAAIVLFKYTALYKRRLPKVFSAKNFKGYLFSVIILHCYMALSTVWAPNPNAELSLRVLLVPLFLFLVYLYLRYRLEKHINLLIAFTFIVGIIYALGGILLRSGEGIRMAAFGGGPNVFVRVVGGGLIACIYLILVKKNRFSLFCSPFLLIAALASGSRGGIIALTLSMLFLSLFVLPQYLKWRIILTTWILIGFLAWISSTLIDTIGIEAIIEHRYIILTIQNLYLSSRDVIFSDAWYIFLDNPLAGAGLGSFEFLSRSGVYPHNIFLHICAEGGLLGASVLLIAMVLLVKRWFKPRNPEHGFLFTLCIFYFFSSLLSGGVYDARFMWLYGMLYMLPWQKNHDSLVSPHATFNSAAQISIRRSANRRPEELETKQIAG